MRGQSYEQCLNCDGTNGNDNTNLVDGTDGTNCVEEDNAASKFDVARLLEQKGKTEAGPYLPIEAKGRGLSACSAQPLLYCKPISSEMFLFHTRV